EVPAVILLVKDGKKVPAKRTGDVELENGELEAAQSSLATGTVLRGGVYPYLSSRFDFWPVQTAKGEKAVIGLAFDPNERPSAPDTPVKLIACVLALVIDRQYGRDGGVLQ